MDSDQWSVVSGQWSVVSGQTDTEAVYLEVVGEGLAPPDENETGINGFARYKIYDNVVGRGKRSARGGSE